MTSSAHFFINTVFISPKSQIILLLESIQTLVFITLKSEGRHQWYLYLLHNLSLKLHSSSIRFMPFSAPIATQLSVHFYA